MSHHRSRSFRRALLACAALVAVLDVAGALGASPAAAATSGEPAAVDRVLVLSMPAVSWRDLELDDLPHLRELFASSGVADLSVRGVRRHPNLGDGYVTINAGTRAVGRTLDEGQCFSADEPFEEGTARDAMARRAGIPVDDVPADGVVCIAQPAIADRNERLLFDAEVGALGDALARAGVHRAVIGNGDRAEPTGSAGYERKVGLALADSDGVVPGGTVGPELLELDPTAPYGMAANNDAYLGAFDEAWSRERAVVVVEASDLVRFDAYRSFVAADARAGLQMRLLRRFDALVGALLERVDPARDAVLVVGPTSGGGTARLTMAAVRSPAFEPGFVRSAYTRRSGIVSIVDIGPTIVDLLGLERPDSMEGRPFESGAGGGTFDDRYEWLVDVDEAARFRDRMIPQVTTWFVVLQVLLVLVALMAFGRAPRVLGVVEFSALVLLGFLPATYLAGFLPFHEWGALPYWVFLFGVGALIAIVARVTTSRTGVDTLLVSLGVVVGVLVVDLVLGGRLQFNTSLGYSPTVAGRFAGIGNLAYSQLAAASVLLAGLIAYRVGGRRGAWLGVGMLGLAIVVDGAPFWGADVGGVLSMVPAFGVTAALLLGWRIRWRLVLVFGTATLALIGLFAAFDASRAEEDQTHLGRLVHTTTDGGWDAFSTVIERKWAANLDVLFSSVWTIMLPLVLAGIGYLVYRAPGRMRGIYERVPPLRASIIGLLVLATLGFLLNDSGIAIPGVMLGVVTPVLLVLLIRRERETAGDEVDAVGDRRSAGAAPDGHADGVSRGDAVGALP